MAFLLDLAIVDRRVYEKLQADGTIDATLSFESFQNKVTAHQERAMNASS